MNKKIFIAAEIFPPQIGGPATYTVELANALAKQNFLVHILCYGQPNKSVLNKNIKINWVSHHWPIFLKYLIYFKKLFWHSLSYSTIYAMGPIASGWPAFWIKKITGKKLIVKVVGDYAWEQAKNLGQTQKLIDDFQTETHSGKIAQLQKIERQVCQSANTVITPSKYLAKIVMGWGVIENKIKVVYNAQTLGFQKPHKNPKNLIVSAGRLVPWKGFNTLIKIFPELLKKNPNFKLNIYGSGPEQEKLNNLIAKLTLTDKIKIEKIDDHEKFLEKLQAAEMFVLNTGYEGLSHTILEAMSVGTPVVTTNVGGNPELIEKDINGLLIEYNNKEQLQKAILKLHQNQELQQKFINNSQEKLKQFSFAKMLTKTIAVLES